MSFDQLAIILLGTVAFFLVIKGDKYAKWGHVVGLCSEPFWFYTAYINQQWGIIVSAMLWTILYSWGLYRELTKHAS